MFHVSLYDFGPLHFQSSRIMTHLAEPLSLSDFRWCSVFPFSQASHDHMFLPTAKLRFSMASPYIDFVTPAYLLLPKQLYFPSQSLTHILWHLSHKATEAMPLLLFLSTIYCIEFFSYSIKDFIPIDLQRPYISSAAKTNQCHMSQVNPSNYSKELMIL